jgi:predicted chitinase
MRYSDFTQTDIRLDEDMDRRGFLRGMLGAGAMAAGLSPDDAEAANKKKLEPGKTAQKIQQVVQPPRKITPEESRGGHSPEELKAYIQACAERYLPREQIARFMGEVAHETDNFTSMVEKNPEKNIKHYGKSGNPLGNSDMNDAWKYIGRGFLQITGKYNYKHFGDKIRQGLGDELLNNPNLAMRKDVSAALAIVYWRERVAPKMQAGASSREIAKAINGKKPKGLKSRELKTTQAKYEIGRKI